MIGYELGKQGSDQDVTDAEIDPVLNEMNSLMHGGKLVTESVDHQKMMGVLSSSDVETTVTSAD